MNDYVMVVERLRYIAETDDARFGGIRETLTDAISLLEQMERERNGAQSAFDEALVTPMMEFKRREWVGLTHDEKAYSNTNYLGKSAEAWQGGVDWAEAKLREKNGD